LRKLNDIPFKSLKASFKMDFQYLKDKIFKDTVPKRINGKKFNGSSLAKFIVEIVNSINNNAIPNINNSWDKVVKDDILAQKIKSFNHFKEFIKKYNESNVVKGENISLSEKDSLIKIFYDKKLESIMKFNKILFSNSDIDTNKTYKNCFIESRKELNNDIDKLIHRAINENDEKCNNFNGRIIREGYREVRKIFIIKKD
jgi:hypothetical protein